MTTLTRCYRCGGAVLPAWADPACLNCGAGLEPPRAPEPVNARNHARTEPRRWQVCPECLVSVRAYGMGAHMKMHEREHARRAS